MTPFTYNKEKMHLHRLLVSFTCFEEVSFKPLGKVNHQPSRMDIFSTFNCMLAETSINKWLLFVKHLLLTPWVTRMVVVFYSTLFDSWN